MLRNLSILLTLALLLFAVACDRGGGNTIAGIDKNTQLDALTAEQSDAYCTHLQEELGKKIDEDKMKRAGCLFGGMMAAAFAGEEEGACQAAYDECLAQESEEEDMDMSEFCPSAEDRAGCSATIEEVTDCLHATLDQAFGAFAGLADLTCADLDTEEGQAKMEEAMGAMQESDGMADVPACAAVREKCPDLG